MVPIGHRVSAAHLHQVAQLAPPQPDFVLAGRVDFTKMKDKETNASFQKGLLHVIPAGFAVGILPVADQVDDVFWSWAIKSHGPKSNGIKESGVAWLEIRAEFELLQHCFLAFAQTYLQYGLVGKHNQGVIGSTPKMVNQVGHPGAGQSTNPCVAAHALADVEQEDNSLGTRVRLY